jgi:hypothetical protein
VLSDREKEYGEPPSNPNNELFFSGYPDPYMPPEWLLKFDDNDFILIRLL